MKFIEIVRPINQDRKHEIEAELEAEKKRLSDATRQAAEELALIREYPIEIMIAILLGGYAVARWLRSRRTS